MYSYSAPAGHGGRRRSRLIVAIGLVVALLMATAGVAEAQSDRVRSHQIDRVRPDRVVETLRLACSADFVQGERGVLCQWSEATNPQTRGYKLYRIVDGSPRELVTTVGVDGRLGFFDTSVSAPSSLVYGVISVTSAGRLLGKSAAVHVEYGTDIDQLRMACTPDVVENQRGVLCRWSESSQSGIRGYLVYRIANDAPRELIATVGLDQRNGYFDVDVSPGASLAYIVTAVDGSGTVLGIGGPATVAWPVTD